jgi:hypothetical protein
MPTEIVPGPGTLIALMVIVAARAPAERAHLVGVDDPLGDQMVDTGNDVVIAGRKVVTDDVVLELLSVVGRTAVVGTQYDVAGAGIDLRVVAAVEAEHVG